MRRNVFVTLTRLERHALDQLRARLVQATARQAELTQAAEARLGAWREAVDHAALSEHALDLWGGLARGTRRVLEMAEAERGRQDTVVDTARTAVGEGLAAFKRAELLARRHELREQREAARREQQLLDEEALRAFVRRRI